MLSTYRSARVCLRKEAEKELKIKKQQLKGRENKKSKERKTGELEEKVETDGSNWENCKSYLRYLTFPAMSLFGPAW